MISQNEMVCAECGEVDCDGSCSCKTQACYDGKHDECRDIGGNCCDCSCHLFSPNSIYVGRRKL